MSKIEDVAKAIYGEYCRRAVAVGVMKVDDCGWEDLAESSRNDYRLTARAALTAMREPTEKMLHDGWEHGMFRWGEGEECAPVWKAMINSALSE